MLLNELEVFEYLSMVKNGDISVEQVIEDLFCHIDVVDNTLRSYLHINKEDALAKAKEIDRKIKNNEDIPPIAGLPIAISDNICTNDIETTAASKMLKGFIPPYDATVVSRIKEAGGIIIGKTNIDEFGMGTTTENSAFQTTLNPWDRSRVPGGSSGGSAVAVAAAEAMIALGSDTGGSVRLPASFCGVTAIKPTYGRISRYGIIPNASSMDQVGIFGKSIKDLAIIMNVICGYDVFDSTSADLPIPDFLSFCQGDIKNIKIGVPKEIFCSYLNAEVKDKIVNSIGLISHLGGIIEDTSLSDIEYAFPAYCTIAMAEASSNMARYDGIQYGLRVDSGEGLEEMYLNSRSKGFGDEIKRRILLGSYILSSDGYNDFYMKAQKVKTIIKKSFDSVLNKYDLIITPTTLTPAFKLGEKKDNPLELFLMEKYTSLASLLGLPAVSINCGFTSENRLPVGLQIIGRLFEEEKVLKLASVLENEFKEINLVKPDLFSKT